MLDLRANLVFKANSYTARIAPLRVEHITGHEDGALPGMDGGGISGDVSNELLAQRSPYQDFVNTRWQISLDKLFKGPTKGGLAGHL